MSGLDWWEISVAGRYTYGNAISRASAEVQAERLRERLGIEVTVIPHEYGRAGGSDR